VAVYLQKAVNVAARPITRAAKANARKIKDTGTQAKSVQSRSSKRRMNMTRAWVGIGASTALVDAQFTGWRGKKYTRTTKSKTGAKSTGLRPSKYAHLVEHGGKFGRFANKARVAPRPLFKAAQAGRTQAYSADFTREIEKGVEATFAKGRALARKLLTRGKP